MGKYTIIVLLLLIQSFYSQAQIDNNLDELKLAFANVQNESYDKAYLYFEQMLKVYPKDPTYNYYVGRCLLFLEKNPIESIKYLRYAATKEVPHDVYFYLGLAYLRNYAFEKSTENFQWFEKKASKKQLKELDFENYKAMAQNGLYLIKYIKKPLVYDKQKCDLSNFHEKYTLGEIKGYFTEKQDYFGNENDSSIETSIMFIPQNIEKGEVLYFSDLNKKRGDYDIYRITRITDTSWSEPENLGNVINTPFDENYPYLHSDGLTLYFASKGHYSMGGFDLYRSSWNWDTQSWTEPENLDFPINSPYDDILFVPSPNKKNACFASDRETNNSDVIIYKLKLNNSESYIELTNHEEVLKYAKLNVNIKSEVTEKSKIKNDNYRTDQTELLKIKDNETFLYKSEYDSLLNLAVNYQLKADSLRWIIDEKRVVFDNTKDGQERVQMSNTIIELETEIYTLQKNADRYYDLVREIEQANLVSQKVIYESVQKEIDVKEKNVENEISKEKIYVEPVIDSLIKSELKIIVDTIEENTITSVLELRIESPSIYTQGNPIPLNESLPNGIIYMIQLGAFSSEKSPAIFKGLTPLSCIKNENSNIRKYFAGKFIALSEAEENIGLIKSKGFKDAYVVAFNNGKIIPINSALKLETKSENLPTKMLDQVQNKETTINDNLEIIYVLKGHIQLKDTAIIDSIKLNLPENIELYLEDNETDKRILIKSFLTYEKAFEIKLKLEAVLSKEIEIHAYFAENQIPLKQARKITK
ncbi:hypothetical protein ACFLS4_02700 [Bacteroidota bacterium]